MARLYRDYGYVVFRRCLAYLGDSSSAQDAVQEVFVRALRAAPGFRGDANPRTWICRIADHFCVDVLRHRQRNPVLAKSDDQAELDAAVGDDDRESFVTIQRLLEGLDPESRRLAVLYYVDELTQEELAAELGLSRRTIGKRLQHVLDHARSVLREEDAS